MKHVIIIFILSHLIDSEYAKMGINLIHILDTSTLQRISFRAKYQTHTSE